MNRRATLDVTILFKINLIRNGIQNPFGYKVSKIRAKIGVKEIGLSWSNEEILPTLGIGIIYYWNKVTVHHLKLCYFLMKKDNTMICGVLLNHCLTVNRIISKSVCLDTRLRDTSLKRCGVKSQFTNSVSCVSIIGVDASLTTTTHASTTTTHASSSLFFHNFTSRFRPLKNMFCFCEISWWSTNP